MAKHGEYQVGRGWFDSSRKGWVDKPDKLTPVVLGAPPREDQREQVRAWGKPRAFKEREDMESLIRLRDSDRVEDRQTFDKIAKGGMRIQMHDYEAAKAAEANGG
ncbi:hypothetical protein ABT304_21060 [Nocardioides sp. NPDC000445]|uniref:hypothetical protein n=1 Tax=Nocardioides sp. NPDC000445 TaxID=3154257 RepID=UPI00331EC562